MTINRQYFRTYMALIENAVGSGMFRNFYVKAEDGREFDAIEDGSNACAFFVSSVLTIMGKLSGIHGLVTSTMKDLEESGWIEVDEAELKPGDVVVWEPNADSNGNLHIGFYVGREEAVSTSSSQRMVIRHDLHYGEVNRALIKAFRLESWEVRGGNQTDPVLK